MAEDRSRAVHPWLPRFSQAITGMISLEALLLRNWPAVCVALGLVVAALAGPRWSPVAWLFRLFARPPAELEPVAPVRFAQGMAVTMLGAAIALWLAGAQRLGWVLVGLVAVVALFSAVSGFCVGCEIYRLLLRGRGGSHDVRDDLGLAGSGPWLVVVTAPGCSRCEPLARQVTSLAAPREIVRVDLSATPSAANTGIRSVPALLAVASDGRLVATRAGNLAPLDIEAVLSA